jgi:hypothetical protein
MERDVARHFTEIVTNGLGAANTTEFVFVANPIENSLIRGTLNGLGLENVSFEAYDWAAAPHQRAQPDCGYQLQSDPACVHRFGRASGGRSSGTRDDNHPYSVMTSCHDGGDRLSVQRGEVDWQGKRAT